MKGLIIILEMLACMLECVNVVVGVDFPQHLDVKGGDQVVEFKLAINLERLLKFLGSSIFQVGDSGEFAARRPFSKV